MVGVAAFLFAANGRADEVLTFDGIVTAGPPNHFTVEFEVPATTKEIQIEHDDLDPDDILDWGLTSPSGFRGWGGGNSEPAVVTELAASRSYLAGPIEPGTWKVDVGKAKIVGDLGSYHIVVTLRDVPTLAPQPERSPYVAPAPVATGARWYAGDFHVHSKESGDARPPIDEIVTFAKSQGLDFVELSDHNTTAQLDFMNDAQSRAGAFLLIPGVEFTTYAGHANGIGATQFVDHKFDPGETAIAAAVDKFHTQGALFALNHPALDLGDACIGCAWKHDLASYKIDAVEVVTAGSASLFYANASATWEKIVGDRGVPVAAIGGSDDHQAGQDIGAFGAPIGVPCTMVYANELSVAAILEGVRSARTVVKVNGCKDPMVELAAEPEVGEGFARVNAVVTGGAGKEAQFVVDGVALDRIPIDADPFTVSTPVTGAVGEAHRYRVEVYDQLNLLTVTSHVFVTTPEVVPPVAIDPDVHPAGGIGCAHQPGLRAIGLPALGAAAALLALVGAVRLSKKRRRR